MVAFAIGVAVLPGLLEGQADPYAPARFNWTAVNVSVFPDSASGVTVWIFSSRFHDPEHHFHDGFRFDPAGIPAWVTRADSLLWDNLPIADTLKWGTPPTLASPDGGLLGVVRAHDHGKWRNRVWLVFDPRPDSLGKHEPIDLDMELPDAREFLDTMRSKSAISRVARVPPDSFHPFVLDASSVQVKPEVISGPPPRYPEELRQNGVQGEVWIEVVVDTLGHPEPTTLKVLESDDHLFEVEARRTILGTRFKPARVNGAAVRVLVMVPINFTLTYHYH